MDVKSAERIMLLKANNCMRNPVDFESLLSILKSKDASGGNLLYGNQAMTEVPAWIIHKALSHYMDDDEIFSIYEAFVDGDRNVELESILIH